MSIPQRNKVPLPVGLKELISDMSREVLRRQPINIYSFLADYLESLLKLRNITHSAEQTLNDIFKTSRDIYDKIILAGFEVIDEYPTVRLIRTHLERYCLELLSGSSDDHLQSIVNDLITQMILLFDDDCIGEEEEEEDSIRIIVETEFQVFLLEMRERNQKNIAAIGSGRNLNNCSMENQKISGDYLSEESEKMFLKNFSDIMEKYIK